MFYAELVNTQHFTGSSVSGSSVDKVVKAIPRRYPRVAFCADKMIHVGVAIETKKHTLYTEDSVRNCTNRSEAVVYNGMFTSQRAILSPFPPC